jgi:hypothetical protein
MYKKSWLCYSYFRFLSQAKSVGGTILEPHGQNYGLAASSVSLLPYNVKILEIR